MSSSLSILSKKTNGKESFLLKFSSKSFMISGLTSKSFELIHFEIIFVYGVT